MSPWTSFQGLFIAWCNKILGTLYFVLFWLWKKCWITESEQKITFLVHLNSFSSQFSMTAWWACQVVRHSENLENFGKWNEHLIFKLFRICYNKYQGCTIWANRFRIGVRNDSLACLQNFCILFLDCHENLTIFSQWRKIRQTSTNSVIASVSEAIQYNNQHWTPIAKPKVGLDCYPNT